MSISAFSNEAFAAKAREVIAEGCVLLRNENSALPLMPGSRVAVFGRTQMNYFKSGLGSGGLVNTRYVIGIWEALSQSGVYQLDMSVRSVYENWVADHPFDMGDGWSNHPWHQQEMPLDASLAAEAAKNNDAAIVILGRTAGEDKDNFPGEGSWLLSEAEERMLEVVCASFKRTIVLLNTGNIIDMNWVEKYKPAAVMYIWQGGQEGGTGVVDVLCGKVSPSGRLTDTIAASITDYPCDKEFGDEHLSVYSDDIYVGYRYFESFAADKVLYHFGEGLSFTSFSHQPQPVAWDGNSVTLSLSVENTGSVASKEVVQVYAQSPQGVLGKPSLTLCAFCKTAVLEPGEKTEITFTIPAHRFASYDDSGATGHAFCWLLEAGEYRFFAGHSVCELVEAGGFALDEALVVEQLEQACAPVKSFLRMCARDGKAVYEDSPVRTASPAQRRIDRMPEEIAQTPFAGLRLEDVEAGRCAMEQFIAQLTDDDLCCIVRGEGMSSPRVTPGTAGAIGGVTDRLAKEFGIPAACCADGPSGIRMDCGNTAFSMPNGTLQACTWNEELIIELYVYEGLEMRKYQVDNLLGPGMNIHRHPLGGRNFEYFSEDPLVTGRMASAQLEGMRRSGVTGTIKHFACNNQEYARRHVNAVVSERALREIYLKGFEIAVKEGGAASIMTSYNPINGWWTAGNYDLNNTILHHEWGFDGIVMTDWWATGSDDCGEPTVNNVSSMIMAQNDLYMVANVPGENTGDDDLAQSLASGRLKRAELQRSAMNICRFVLGTPAFRRAAGMVNEEDRQLQQLRDDEGDVILSVPEIRVGAETMIPAELIDTGAGKATLFQLKLDNYGQYRIDVTCRASESVPDTAQLPVSLFIDSQLLGAHVLNGGEKEWKTVSVTTREIRRRLLFYTKFFFAVGGLEIKEVRIIRLKTFGPQGDQ